MADELHAELTRLRELTTTFHRTGQAIDAITTTASAVTVAASLTGASTSAACHSGAHSARAAIDLVVEHYRILHTGTRTCTDSYENADGEQARRIDVLRRTL